MTTLQETGSRDVSDNIAFSQIWKDYATNLAEPTMPIVYTFIFIYLVLCFAGVYALLSVTFYYPILLQQEVP